MPAVRRRRFPQLDPDDWIKAIDANMLTPIELIKATVGRHDGAEIRPHRQHQPPPR